jgi:hypothetical protein
MRQDRRHCCLTAAASSGDAHRLQLRQQRVCHGADERQRQRKGGATGSLVGFCACVCGAALRSGLRAGWRAGGQAGWRAGCCTALR